jgi:transposase-like protein
MQILIHTPEPKAIRKAIYTTNAIESLNSVIRKSIKNRKIFMISVRLSIAGILAREDIKILSVYVQ